MTTTSSAGTDADAGTGETLADLYVRLGGSPQGLSATDAATRLASPAPTACRTSSR